MLCINNLENIIVKSLVLVLYGEIKINLDINNMIYFDESINIFRINLYYNFINNKFLYENQNNNFLLNSCKKNIKINIKIPDLNLPATYYYDSIKVIYNLMFILNYNRIMNNKVINEIVEKEKEINIIPLIYTFDNDYLVPITLNKITKINDKNIYGDFVYSIFIPHKSYISGDKVNIELKILNLINVNNYILVIKIKLKRQLIFNKFFDYIENNENIFTYCKKIVHNKYNNNIIKINDLQIPNNCNYSILSESTNNIFELKYFLKINITILNNNKVIPLKEANIPITIGSYRTNYKNIDILPFLPKYEK